MFLSSDLMSTRKSKSIDNRDMRYSSMRTQTQNLNDQKDAAKIQQQDSLTKKIEKFMSVNKKHQFDQVCVCEDCIYVNQLQRYESLKMDLSKNSSYRAQYNKNNLKKQLTKAEDLTESSILSKPQEGNISKNPHVHIDSVYRNQYASRSLEKVEKPHPSDLLKFTGPSSALSSYKQMYPNLNGSFQYVEPLRQQHLPLLPRKFKAQSLYTNDYKNSKAVQTESGKMNDQLRLGRPSMVKETTHKRQYINPQNYNLRTERNNSSGNKRIQEPSFSYQYKTINRDQFEKPPSKKNCRAKRLQVLHGQMLTNENFSTIV